MTRLHIDWDKKDHVVIAIKSAISSEIKRLELGLDKTNRRIEEVIKVDQADQEPVRNELQEYILTDSIKGRRSSTPTPRPGRRPMSLQSWKEMLGKLRNPVTTLASFDYPKGNAVSFAMFLKLFEAPPMRLPFENKGK